MVALPVGSAVPLELPGVTPPAGIRSNDVMRQRCNSRACLSRRLSCARKGVLPAGKNAGRSQCTPHEEGSERVELPAQARCWGGGYAS